jgi:hypothetical protein
MQVFVVFSYVDYRKEVGIRILRAYDRLDEAVAYAKALCAKPNNGDGDDDDDVVLDAPEYVWADEPLYDAYSDQLGRRVAVQGVERL